MTRKEQKQKALAILNGYIQELKEFGDGYGIIEKYDGAMSIVRNLGLITPSEEDALDKQIDEIIY